MCGGGGGFLGGLESIANFVAPMAGAFLGGPLGAAGASAALGMAEGESPTQALEQGAMSGASSFLGPMVGDMFGGVVSSATGDLATPAVDLSTAAANVAPMTAGAAGAQSAASLGSGASSALSGADLSSALGIPADAFAGGGQGLTTAAFSPAGLQGGITGASGVGGDIASTATGTMDLGPSMNAMAPGGGYTTPVSDAASITPGPGVSAGQGDPWSAMANSVGNQPAQPGLLGSLGDMASSAKQNISGAWDYLTGAPVDPSKDVMMAAPTDAGGYAVPQSSANFAATSSTVDPFHAAAAKAPSGAAPFDYGTSWLGKGGVVPQNFVTEAIAKESPFQAAGQALTGGMMLKNMLTPQQQPAGLDQLMQQASQNTNMQNQLMQRGMSGTVSPAQQAQLQQQVAASQAAIRSQYAQMGMSGSTAEQQALAAVQSQAIATQGNMAANMMQSGVQLSGMTGSELSNIARMNQLQANEANQAFSNFASALSGVRMG